MNRNLNGESDDSNSDKCGTDDGKHDSKELAQKLNKDEILGEPVRSRLCQIFLKQFVKIPNHMKK